MALESFPFLDQVLTTIGGWAVLWALLKVSFLWGHWVRTYVLSRVWKGVEVSQFGPWAVVTGATAGIGKSYACQLAKRGLDVVLISRSMEKLEAVAAEIENKYGRRTKVIQADFTQGPEIYERIRAALQGLEIGLLVNNVGMTQEKPCHFLAVPNNEKFLCDVVNCNMLSTVKMTQIILPQMVARKKGVIINLASEAATTPTPLLTVYSATKIFDDFFSRGLEQEYRSKGIIVQSVLPVFVESNMVKNLNISIKMSSEKFTDQALNTVGITERSHGCLSHAIQSFFLSLIPKWFKLSPFGVSLYDYINEKVMKKN